MVSKLILLILLFFSLGCVIGQTTLKVVDKPEFNKFMDYCNTPISRTFYMIGEVSVVKYNPDFANPIKYYAQPVTGDWMAKYPLVIKWYAIGTKSTSTEAYQHEIIVPIEVKVPRVYCTSQTAYITYFYKYWKTGMIQSGWFDSRFIGIWNF